MVPGKLRDREGGIERQTPYGRSLMHDGHEQSVAVLTLGEPLVAELGWALVDLGYNVISFESLADAAPAIVEDLVSVVVLNAAVSAEEKAEALREVRSLAPATPVVEVLERHSSPVEGVDAVLVPPYDAGAMAAVVGPLLERHGGFLADPGGP